MLALWRSAILRSPFHSPCMRNIWCKPSIVRATPSYIPGNLTRSRLIQTNLSAQWPTSRVFQTRFFSTNNAPAAEGALPVLSPRSVGTWLMVSSTLVFAIIVVGGITRLTESGLSITEWRPVTGILPPLTDEEWVVEFDKYKGTPEFKMYEFASRDLVRHS